MSQIAELLGPDGPLVGAIPAFEHRPEQQTMAAWVDEALAGRGTLAVEAGTGTGKTYAYLVPALLSGLRVVVSTATRTLQDQLYHRDLPMLAAALGRPVKVTLLKGRSNYLCKHRLAGLAQTPELPGLAAAPTRAALGRVLEWAGVTRMGDVSEVDDLPDDHPVWPAVTSTRENCLGIECPEIGRCHLVKARREAQSADVVVVNHHLLLADMAIREEGFGELLPGADAVILDEAHQVPETAAKFFGQQLSSRRVIGLARDLLPELMRTGLVDPLFREALSAMEEEVAAALKSLGRGQDRTDWAALPDAFIEGLRQLVLAIERLAQLLESAASDDPGLRACLRRGTSLVEEMGQWLARSDEEGLRWVDLAGRSFTLGFSPFEVADRLGGLMRERPCSWIFTSATLAVGDDFSHFLKRIGASDARTLRLDSPFDYDQQCLLCLPDGLPEPADPEHTTAVLTLALPLIEAAGGRTFLLFTSHRALREAARLLRARAHFADDYELLVQGEAPRDVLLRRFRERPASVLLGSASFWEGVDVRGTGLVVVVIDKLPFAAPDDPLLKARLEGITREGGNPFMQHQLPQAVLALKQGFGRLIRDREDFGVVLIGDRRLRTRAYGRTFIESLPPARRVSDVEQAAGFLRDRLSQAGVEP
ncbi:MAG: ATP-dependent DNA helicase [Steroidobacteraceae bacterium]